METIGINSFAFCKKLAAITIPAGVTKIVGNFAGCAKELVIRVEKGSYAEQYCTENGLNFEYIPE